MANHKSGYTQKKAVEYRGDGVCHYGCGLPARYQQGNGKLVCAPSRAACPKYRATQARPKVELTGEFGFWTVVSYVPQESGKGGWLCRCVCGKKKQVRGEALKKGISKSCGCQTIGLLSKARSKPNNHRTRNTMYHNYRRAAVRRGYAFEITFDEFSSLISQDCAYCGQPPSTLFHDDYAVKATKFYAPGEFYYNGVDRVDNAIGYTVGNVVPCCKICNQAKHTLTVGEWLQWAKRLYKFQFEGKSNESTED